MRYGFVTCVELGLSCVETVLDLGGEFELLMTLQDDLAVKKSGRAYLDGIAEGHDIPLVKIRNINDADAVEAIREADLDWLFIIGWSQIAEERVLNSTRRGVLGMHPTLLPQGRGRASVPWAILKGLERTGVTMFKLDSGVDTGPILEQAVIEIAAEETAASLYGKVNQAHIDLMRSAFPLLQAGSATLTPQDESRASEWPGRRPADGEIQSSVMTAIDIDRLVRAVTRPYPGAFLTRPNGTMVRVWKGHPVLDSTTIPPDQTLVIDSAEGQFLATEFEYEHPNEQARASQDHP